MSAPICLYPRYVIPVEPRGTVYEAHALVLQDTRILEILPAAQARVRYTGAEAIDLPGHVLLPGLINAHAHSAMVLLRGLADDLALMDWLHNHIWPAEARHVSDAFVYDGSVQAMAEMLRGGTTTVNDMYFHHDAVARAAIDTGMRTVVGCSILDFPTVYAQNAHGYLAHAEACIRAYQGTARLHFRLAPHAPYTVSDDSFRATLRLADTLNVGLHCHIHETADELEHSLNTCGMRPLARLDRLGVLSSRLIAAHMVHSTEDERALLLDRGVAVAHNPASNLKLASGLAAIDAMHTLGLTLALGTDGAASNNQLDMLGDMRLAALLAKGASGIPTALSAAAALEMATLGGARALGLEQEIGSLLPGKTADLIAIDLDQLETQPVFDPLSHVVYAASRSQVSHVWVDGACLLRDRQLTRLDLSALKARAVEWRTRIVAPAQAD